MRGQGGYNNFRKAALKPTIKDPRHKNLEGLNRDDHHVEVGIRIRKLTNSERYNFIQKQNLDPLTVSFDFYWYCNRGRGLSLRTYCLNHPACDTVKSRVWSSSKPYYPTFLERLRYPCSNFILQLICDFFLRNDG